MNTIRNSEASPVTTLNNKTKLSGDAVTGGSGDGVITHADMAIQFLKAEVQQLKNKLKQCELDKKSMASQLDAALGEVQVSKIH